MSPERWQQVKQLLDHALQCLPEERALWLAEVCAGDQALKLKLETLLRAADNPLSIMDAPLEQVASLLADIEEPDTIGPYRILKTLGHGGMGVVYLAERSEIDRQVALKVVGWGRTTSEHVQRFLLERRVLARLQHPNIVQLLDIGITDNGLPYVVMEYVEGESITTYCDTHRCTIEQRLELFLTVCEAVQYAHSNLVIHRDLKPSNILVRRSDQTGAETVSALRARVKLLDFGIAKLIEEEPERPDLTRTGMRVMTPAYASPEQVQGTTVSTTSDVYSLGILLYELLTGRRPYQVEGKRPSEIEHIICETDPIKPSAVVMATDSTIRTGENGHRIEPEVAAMFRNMRPERLQRRLRGDLDTIILKALRKEPRQRYRSVEQFADDVLRYLDGIPVQARASTIGYRVGKFVRRHRAGVIMTAVFVCILVAVVRLFMIEITIERDRAQQEAAKAEQVKEFMVDVFRSNNLGLVAQAQGYLEKAESLFRNSLQIGQHIYGSDDPRIATDYHNLALVLERKGSYDEAKQLYLKALELDRSKYTDVHPNVATDLHSLARLLYLTGDYDSAYVANQEAMALYQQIYSQAHPHLGNSLHNQALVLHSLNRLEEAEAMFMKTRALEDAVYGAEAPIHAITLKNLALLYVDQGRYVEADRLMQEAVDLQHALPADHLRKSDIHMVLGFLRMVQKRYDEATEILEEVLENRIRTLPKDHWKIAETQSVLGRCFAKQKRFAEADALLRQSYALLNEKLGMDHNLTRQTQSWLAELTQE